MSVSRKHSGLALLALAVACSSSEKKVEAIAPAPTWLVHGVVVDAKTQAFVQDVKVTLQSVDALPATSTDANGYYKFTPTQAQMEEFLLQYQKGGYSAITVTVKRSYSDKTTTTTTTTANGATTTTAQAPLYDFTCQVNQGAAGAGSCEVVYDPAKPD